MKVKPLGTGGIAGLLAGDTMAGFEQRGKMDYSNGFGFAVLGASRFGDDRLMGGIYQRRRKGYNQFTGPPTGSAGTYFVKMRTYRPTNPQTVEQQDNRSKFANAVVAWSDLTNDEKLVYNSHASIKGRLGRWDFISEYMRHH